MTWSTAKSPRARNGQETERLSGQTGTVPASAPAPGKGWAARRKGSWWLSRTRTLPKVMPGDGGTSNSRRRMCGSVAARNFGAARLRMSVVFAADSHKRRGWYGRRPFGYGGDRNPFHCGGRAETRLRGNTSRSAPRDPSGRSRYSRVRGRLNVHGEPTRTGKREARFLFASLRPCRYGPCYYGPCRYGPVSARRCVGTAQRPYGSLNGRVPSPSCVCTAMTLHRHGFRVLPARTSGPPATGPFVCTPPPPTGRPDLFGAWPAFPDRIRKGHPVAVIRMAIMRRSPGALMMHEVGRFHSVGFFLRSHRCPIGQEFLPDGAKDSIRGAQGAREVR